MLDEKRPDPDHLLAQYRENRPSKRGLLKVYFGFAAGVGKTYGMLREAREKKEAGLEVVIGYVEPHARPETIALIEGFPILPTKKMSYRQIELEEFDLDGALELKPDILLVDELAHTNVVGSRNKKRYQDIEELLNAGINVYTTVNVQHIESLNDIVEEITLVHVAETVPDRFFDEALIKLIDVEPEDLLVRLKEGKIYRPANAERAMANFFTLENLGLLREIAIRKAADHISMENRYEMYHGKKKVQGKLLAYIDTKSKRGAEKTIRWTARLATAFRLEWVVLYIQDEYEEDAALPDIITHHFELAEKLGAETVFLNSDEEVETIVHYATITGISDIIIGKNKKRKIASSLFRPELEDSLIKELADVDIHIIPYQDELTGQAKFAHAKKGWRKRWLTTSDVLKTVVLIGLATVASELFIFFGMGDQTVIIVYLFSVLMVSTVTEGYIYGVIASVASVLVFNWFFVAPLYSLTVNKSDYPITLVIMLSVALITSNMMMRVNKQARESIQKEHRMEVIYKLNKNLLTTKSIRGIVELTNNYVANALEKSVIFYPKPPQYNQKNYELEAYLGKDELAARLATEEEQGVANWVFNNGKEAGYGSDTLMGSQGYYLPVISQGEVLAVMGVLCKKQTPLTHENRNFLKLIAAQVSLVLDRQKLTDKQQQIIVENEKEKMRGTLLRAISHDLRTPLTGIQGASSAILDQGDQLPKEVQQQLLVDIQEDSEWLIRMVENLLSVTRIDEGTMRVKKVSEAAEEIVEAAVNRVRKRFKKQEIQVSVPDELLLVPMDGKLIEQVLINLMENAIKHSDSTAPICVKVTKEGDSASFEVSDQGQGISEELLQNLFQRFERTRLDEHLPSDSKRGLGIGLSICQTIVSAHEGTIIGRNQPEGGAIFIFTLPLSEKEVS